MIKRTLDPEKLGHHEDWVGNNAAFCCPLCQKVFLVSGHIHKGRRECPKCSRSVGYVDGGSMSGGTARIEWPDRRSAN
jgi:hypothetical protein